MLDERGLRRHRRADERVNGGSFAVTAVHESVAAQAEHRGDRSTGCSSRRSDGARTRRRRTQSSSSASSEHRDDLPRARSHALRADGKRILGYGASTKGNVILQFCGLTADDIPAIAEVNPDKFGAFTPGTEFRSSPRTRRAR